VNRPSNRARTLPDQLQLLLLLVFAFGAGAETALRWRDGRWPFDIALPEPRSWTLPLRQSPGQSIFARDDAGQAVRLDRPESAGTHLPKPVAEAPKQIRDRVSVGAERSALPEKKEILDRILPEP